MDFPIQGMENVIATVSGYHGLERLNLIKLITQAGASYVGEMSKPITHLVCWKFEGRKYELAKQFKTMIVNHRWVEDCIKQGKRVPEQPYMLQSGKDEGPLLMEASLIYDVGPSNKTCNALDDKSNISDYVEGKFYCMDWGNSSIAAWSGCVLLDENLLSVKIKENNSPHKSKSKQGDLASKKENSSSGRYRCKEPPLYDLVGLEHDNSRSTTSMNSARQKRTVSWNEEPSTDFGKYLEKGKRKISNDIESTFFDKSCSNLRRLVKGKHRRENMDIELLDSDQDFHSAGLHNKFSKAEYRVSEQKVNMCGGGRTSNEDTNCDKVSIDQTFDDIVEIRDGTSLEKPSGCDKSMDLSQCEPVTRLAISEELACVICWTEYSSTRGVLPCGHRFCYSCIQNWADHMIGSRKTSTCPLCKVGFVSITKVDDASDQKIYSQTIPCPNSATEILLLNDQERLQSAKAEVCAECGCREPEDLLIICDHCNKRSIHMYCLDPPLIPWTCIHCKDLQRLLYQGR